MASLRFFKRKKQRYQPLLLLLLTTCIWPLFSAAAAAQFARLYDVQGGAVYLRRRNWSKFYRTYPRTMLLGDDLLNVEVGADVVLLCPDGFLSDSIQVGVSNVGATCVGTPRSVRPSVGVSDQWYATDAGAAYTISPWSEQVTSAAPPLRWNAVDGVEQYEVTLQRRLGETWTTVWTVTSAEASIDYPADQPELEAGEDYALRVTVASPLPEPVMGASADAGDTSPSVTFQLIDGFDQQSLAEEIAEVEAFEVDAVTKTLILVEDVYPRYKLFSQGINELTALIEAGNSNELVYRLLGDYYIRSGLALPAESSYLNAIDLAQSAENVEEEALAAWGLGTLYGRTGKTEDACTYLHQAQKLATELGDSDLMENIDAEVVRLSSVGIE